MYACSAWPNSRSNGTSYTVKIPDTLQSIQARGARTIFGAFRATAEAAPDVEAHLLPVAQRIEKHNMFFL
jgi:hypothetical protein